MRQQFNIRNNIGEYLSFQTNSSSGTTFDPLVSMASSRRGHWDLGVGTQYSAGTSISYTYSNSTTKNVRYYVDRLKNITSISISSDNLIGHLNLSGITLGGTFAVDSNPELTGITHSYSNSQINIYSVLGCDIIGTLDLTMFPNIGTTLSTQSNSNLNYILHTATSRNFTSYIVNSCDLIGTHDISMLSNFGGSSSASTCDFWINNNTNLTNITFPAVNTYFRNFISPTFGCFRLDSCNLGYVDFKPLSGATFLSGATQGAAKIDIKDNDISTGDVNHILVDFSGNTTVNPTGWSNINLNIGGTNADPDSSSGGYDGLAAISFLTGSPYNWTITY